MRYCKGDGRTREEKDEERGKRRLRMWGRHRDTRRGLKDK